MVFNGLLTDAELGGNLLIKIALGDILQYFYFSGG
jgi:hypothetical protein